MRKEYQTITTNMMFLCESKINIPENSIVELYDTKIELEYKDGLKIYKDDNLIETNIVDFKNICSEMISNLHTLDFWTKEFLERITKEKYILNLSLSNAISSNGRTGYILETIVSFPRNSEFHKIWNDERKRKGELFMRRMSNC